MKQLWATCLSLAQCDDYVSKYGALLAVASELIPDDEQITEYMRCVSMHDGSDPDTPSSLASP